MDYNRFGVAMAKQEALHRTYVNTLMSLLSKGSYALFEDDDHFGYLDELIKVQALDVSIREHLNQKPAYRMITLNFADKAAEPDAEKVYRGIDLLLAKKWVGEAWCSLEYYTEDGVYSHPHIHIFMRLANLVKKKSEIIRELHDTLEKKFYIKLSKNFIDVKSHKDKKNGYNYVTRKSEKKTKAGTKKDLKRLERKSLPTLQSFCPVLKRTQGRVSDQAEAAQNVQQLLAK